MFSLLLYFWRSLTFFRVNYFSLSGTNVDFALKYYCFYLESLNVYFVSVVDVQSVNTKCVFVTH